MRKVIYCLFSCLLFCGFSAYGVGNAANVSSMEGASFNPSAYCKEIKDVKSWAMRLNGYSDSLDMLRTVHFYAKYIKIRGKQYQYSQFPNLPAEVVGKPAYANRLMSNLLSNWGGLVAFKNIPLCPSININIPHPHFMFSSDSGWQAVCHYLFKGDDSGDSCGSDFASDVPLITADMLMGLVEGFGDE